MVLRDISAGGDIEISASSCVLLPSYHPMVAVGGILYALGDETYTKGGGLITPGRRVASSTVQLTLVAVCVCLPKCQFQSKLQCILCQAIADC